MAARAAAELRDGFHVHLGVGVPTLVADHIPPDMRVILQSDSSLQHLGGVVPGRASAYFNSADNFAMIRGGHIDLVVLGAMQVAANGDLANWMIPGKSAKGMGGAMDLVAGVRRVVVIMDHVEKSGAPKLVEACALPLTGQGVVDMVVTDLGVFRVDRGKRPPTLVELAPGVTVEEVRAKTGAAFEVALA
ncbi:succinyl-CoA--3-ketoacid-CoA transferase [Phenylobacterium sp. LjRoot225]|uniref:CoA-transferase n=1 Tax=Phenylobacterium sp. LjRoot225 TaxID=3342285 RepID=UPI003ECE3771